jgi:hypothetical protein
VTGRALAVSIAASLLTAGVVFAATWPTSTTHRRGIPLESEENPQ